MSEPGRDLRKENYRLREKMDPRYKKAYEEILAYIRVNTIARDQETEAAVNRFLKQIIQAQREGKGIEAVTGSDHKAFADDLIEGLPKRNVLKFAGILAIILVGVNLLFDYTIEMLFRLIDSAPFTTTIRVPSFITEMIITAGFGVAFIYLIFYVYRQIAFRRWSFWKEYGLYLLVGVGLFLIYIIFSYLVSSIDIGPSLEINMFLIILLGVAFIIAGIVVFKRRNNAYRY
ncbi:DUF1129 family protein [Salinicoccus hispanicus]|uniref:DUF1129 family protein n=1 Tax=Salinicoccus hispanicus TaxID=157225 RepID=A0A6N8U5W7_9STAP|nr:DUF1129 family protein [Salinicoccus hispanicus]MXQ51701.1 DUF1129 family protein [Salinicoccus hispanicus]